jgi:membrane protein YdbS with pleckstrin-like domain
MAFFDNHLDSDELILVRFRPARRTFLLEYLLVLLTLCATLVLISFRLMFWLNTAYDTARLFTVLVYLFAIITLILLVRVEYKIWSVRYALTSEKIMQSFGIFTEEFKSTVYTKVTDIGLTQSFIDKILNTGTITMNTAGGDEVEIKFERIARPFEIKKIISDKQTEKIEHVSKVKSRHNKKS